MPPAEAAAYPGRGCMGTGYVADRTKGPRPAGQRSLHGGRNLQPPGKATRPQAGLGRKAGRLGGTEERRRIGSGGPSGGSKRSGEAGANATTFLADEKGCNHPIAMLIGNPALSSMCHMKITHDEAAEMYARACRAWPTSKGNCPQENQAIRTTGRPQRCCGLDGGCTSTIAYACRRVRTRSPIMKMPRVWKPRGKSLTKESPMRGLLSIPQFDC